MQLYCFKNSFATVLHINVQPAISYNFCFTTKMTIKACVLSNLAKTKISHSAGNCLLCQ